MDLTVNNYYNIQQYGTNGKSTTPCKFMLSGSNLGDRVEFKGKSMPSMYSSTFDFLVSEIFSRNKKYQIDGSLLSASKISEAIKNVFDKNTIFSYFAKADVQKIKWKSYIPNEVREFSINKINDARKSRLAQWKDFLENPEKLNSSYSKYQKLVKKVDGNKSLKLVIWDAVTSEIKDSNRHIPVPFDEQALYETIKDFENVEPKLRAVRCAKPSFLDIYTHRLRDNLLMEMNLSHNTEVWVKIPSIKHNKIDKEKNISALEILSYKNWCTRSSVDKAEDALKDGDFYIYLCRDSSNIWQPQAAMTTYRGEIDQIQGIENNNIIPINLLDKIKSYISSQHLTCRSGVLDEGPKAYQQILISEKLSQVDPIIKKNFSKVIKDNDVFEIFKFLGVNVKAVQDNMLEIGTYKPVYSLNPLKGISVPYAMFGINEDILLKNVKTINGNFVLYNKNPIYNSFIKQFPQNLQKVTGKVICTKNQYEMFFEDINRVVGNDKSRIIVH